MGMVQVSCPKKHKFKWYFKGGKSGFWERHERLLQRCKIICMEIECREFHVVRVAKGERTSTYL